MKKIKLITTISLLILASVIMSSSTLVQNTNSTTKTFMYYVNVHLSTRQLNSAQYRVEIWDQFGWRVLAPQLSRPGESIYVFEEKVPVSVSGFNRIAHVIFLSDRTNNTPALWAYPDVKQVSTPGNYNFNLYPIFRQVATSTAQN